MKKLIMFLFCITIILCLFNNKKEVLIPKDSIRYRIIASDNSLEAQDLKWQLNEEIMPYLNNVMSFSTNIKETRNNINNILPKIDNILSTKNIDYNISFGNNYFPEKKYKGVTYDAGKYESLVITIGRGQGENWWCVMFPPLCLLEAKETELDDISYRFYIKDIINKYF